MAIGIVVIYEESPGTQADGETKNLVAALEKKLGTSSRLSSKVHQLDVIKTDFGWYIIINYLALFTIVKRTAGFLVSGGSLTKKETAVSNIEDIALLVRYALN